jgi:branched-chain amino acid transport system ATP-binding protein
MSLLEISDLVVRHGAVTALHGVSLQVAESEILCLIGANGAGKSTLMLSVAGVYAPASGEIRFQGETITRRPAHMIARSGLSLVPEGRHIFPRLTVAENLRLGAREGDLSRLSALLELFPILERRWDSVGGLLSGGEQQMLAVARALIGRPRLLLLDEPSLGLAPLVTAQIFESLRVLNREEGLSILLVEQNATKALALAHRGIVLANGKIRLEGPASELLNRAEVREAYLG